MPVSLEPPSHLSLIFKRFILINIPFILIFSGIFGFTFYKKVNFDQVLVETTMELAHIQFQFQTITQKFQHTVAELLFFAEQRQLMALLEEKKESNQHNLEKNYQSFLKQSGLYDQIRFIDAQGMEKVRVEFKNKNPHITPKKELQYKGDRSYFEQTLDLERGQVYISPLDLNIENGKIERPFKPMIRFATPVFDSKGERRGILILNFFGENLLRSLRANAHTTHGQISLVNSEGYWLLGEKPGDEWGFMIKAEGSQNLTYTKRYPVAWEKISQQKLGQFYDDMGFFTFDTIYPFREINKINSLFSKPPEQGKGNIEEYYWKTISRIPNELIDQGKQNLIIQYITYLLGSIILFGVISWIVTKQYTYRQNAEKQVLQGTQHYRSLFENMLEGYAYCEVMNDRKNRVIDFIFFEVNDAFASIISRPKEKVIGKRLLELFPKMSSENPAFFELCKNAALYGIKGKQEFYFPLLFKWLNVSVYSPKPNYFVSVFEDITTRKKVEAALEKNKNELEQIVMVRTEDLHTAHNRLKEAYEEQQTLNKLKDEFIATTSHELRTPLASILGFAETMDECVLKEEEQKRFIKYIIEEAERLGLVIQNTLDVSLISSGTLEFRFKEADLDEILNNSLQSVHRHLNAKENLQILLPDTGIRFVCDPSRMMQVFINLLDNAITYSPDSNAFIKVSVDHQEDQLLIVIKDEGPGIPAGELKNIFQKFYRVKGKNRPIKGTGLGLTITKAIVEEHGGKIWAENIHRGAAFFVSIPMQQSTTKKQQ